jgi:anti-sigma factor RsiW
MTTCFEEAAGTIELYFYGELDEDARGRLEQHLSTCPKCRHALNELYVIRRALATRPEVSAPPEGDWTGFMNRLTRGIEDDSLGAAERTTAASWRRGYGAYIAIAALLALVTVSVAQLVRSRFSAVDGQTAWTDPGSSQTAPWSENAAFASLSEQHFDRAKLVVLGLANKEAGDGLPAEWEYERELASTLLADTRLYRLAAEDRGMNQLARTMGDLELVLLQASLSQDPQPETLAQIQRLIRKRDLVTRMNVVAAAGM